MQVPAMAAHLQKLFHTDVNVVIILGGTNDIIRHVPGGVIGLGVIEIHTEALRLMRQNGVDKPHTIAITIPDMHADQQEKEEERLIANKIIRKYAADNPSTALLYDMERLWTGTRDGDQWSPDGVHFSSLGYEAMGYQLYELMKLHLMSKNSI